MADVLSHDPLLSNQAPLIMTALWQDPSLGFRL